MKARNVEPTLGGPLKEMRNQLGDESVSMFHLPKDPCAAQHHFVLYQGQALPDRDFA